MNEPIYEYKKGHGWVVTVKQRFTLLCGTVVTLEYRRPNRGEPYMAVRKDAAPPHATLEDYFVARASRRTYAMFSVKNSECDDDYDYCTVVRGEWEGVAPL